jgi:excisionase family DNA binding protein
MVHSLSVIPSAQLCEQLGVSRSTIKRWITERNFPSPIKASGREPLFDVNQVEAWIKQMETSND